MTAASSIWHSAGAVWVDAQRRVRVGRDDEPLAVPLSERVRRRIACFGPCGGLLYGDGRAVELTPE